MADNAPNNIQHITLRWNDFDRYDHLNNCKFLDISQEARIAFLRENFADRDQEFGVFVRHVDIDYLRPVMADTTAVEVETTVTEIGNTSFKTRQDLKDRQGRVCGVVNTVLVAVDLTTAAPREITQAERGILNAGSGESAN
ncbi:acyl-CoA thioester hydrolase [Corynebacterium appendicis CIP 107643]|uniref:Acyl-CoA thioester hydrolase n=1 Tax=Corynebacterium appendicis CIP 107643 TaxID=1161099 RepID=A0A1N7JPA6_9CORY|nr:acyl-CoA thioesterase [Corynebacterium appendicis]MCT1683274.1 acyl-CoA thioesterase [Corynebacterium appendicis]MDK8625578.1 acyl-CoA thioesterase [Corynebacterium appendicis]WJY61723.1 Thioesterase superfamily protein [Corynebacterium appendicis CIP 107643]SIS51182.1 acyl-CoA thioester hydrolase [Corynebacterium appendicis CIP 107643]